jgi:hypothetical protein
MVMTIAARPGGLLPEHLWLASDEDKMVVSVLAPEVAGPARHDTVGPVTVVIPYPVSRTGPGGMVESGPAKVGLWMPRSGGARIGWAGTAGSAVAAAAGAWAGGPWAGAAVAAVGIGASVWQGLRRYGRVARQWTEGHQVLTHHDDRALVNRAADRARYIAAAWPALRVHVGLDDPAPVLVRQLWDLTLLVGERAAARDLRGRLVAAGYGVPAGTTTAAELADRIARTDDDIARLDADIEQRSVHLRRLADEVAAFVIEQEALARANAMICDADRRRDVPAPALPDAVVDLADHTTAVLAAYRELTQLPGPCAR